MIKIIANGSPWMRDENCDIDELKWMLKTYTLHPRYEEQGSLISKNVEWKKGYQSAVYPNCTIFFGDFLKYEHFSIL